MTVTVEELMTRSTITVTPSTTIQEARRIATDARVRHLPVVNGDRRLVGVVSDRDLLASRVADAAEVSTIMSTEPQTAFSDTPAYEAAALMLHHGFNCLPVIDTERRLIGLITATDILLEAHELLAGPPLVGDTPAAQSARVEHAVLRDLIARVRAAAYPDTALVALGALRTFLVRHFDREEREGGLLEKTSKSAPELASEAVALRAQHVTMLSQLDAVIDDNRALADSGSVDVSADVAPFLRSIEEHEGREAELLRKTILR